MPAARRRHIDISAHLTPDELALLAEGRAGEAAERFRDHLSHCKSCYQAYQDAVEFRARALAGQEPHAPPELLQNGRKVPFRRSSGSRVTRTRSVRTILVTVATVLALGATWIFFGPGRVKEPSYVAVLRNVAADASEQGLMFPELSGEKTGSLPRMRGNGSSKNVQGIIDSLRTLSQDGKASTEDFYWLVFAELATDNMDLARLYLQQAPVDSDPRFLKLRAIFAYRESNLTAAEQDLRSVFNKNPNDDETVLNLGLVLMDMNERDKALPLLQRAQGSAQAAISQRAKEALESRSDH